MLKLYDVIKHTNFIFKTDITVTCKYNKLGAKI